MINYKDVPVPASTRHVIDKITCDKCGKVNELTWPEQEFTNWPGTSITIDAGYGSRFDFLNSERLLRFDVCDDCTDEFLKQLKVEVNS